MTISEFIAQDGVLVVQPRMGFSDPDLMRRGLLAVAQASARAVATITLDSYTRVNDVPAAAVALRDGVPLNGYPILNHPPSVTRAMVEPLVAAGIPVQVRHGSALPLEIFAALAECGLAATEGGPVSYCLPYSRVPLPQAVDNWARACDLLARAPGAHLESFGGCMLGQLCPPSLLVAISVLEAMFFRQHGLRSVSLSYAQQTDRRQDMEAMDAMHRIAAVELSDVDWHIVLYAYMGVFPRTRSGALDLLGDAAELAVHGGADRLIVKTPAEAFRIPTIEENISAMEYAAAVADEVARGDPKTERLVDTGVYAEARTLVDAVLDLSPDIGRALRLAFARGVLDVPYCLHPDNAGLSRGVLDDSGRLRWSRVGRMPLPRPPDPGPGRSTPSADLLSALSYVERKYDRATL
ncbi:methylaspartate mutase [Actinokineospora fastidiosa]|uniref:Methylaspartate mutase n=1 Tax=Actinokineospora fastidiosa TaxID=1816 RepID=A0A918GJ49_9PSEU|nr:methylaspartate mutase [Actinokineospora fastidiosa]GGS36091.1 methylaspartate mutase [Actinokineospora fastidiosa]